MTLRQKLQELVDKGRIKWFDDEDCYHIITPADRDDITKELVDIWLTEHPVKEEQENV